MHPNEKVLRDADEAQVRGDNEAFMAAHTDDVVVHVPGTSDLAGDHKGKEAFMKVFQMFMERVPEFEFESHAYLADDEHGVILQRSHYKRGDQTLDSDEIFVCHFRDGKISELWLFSPNQAALDKFIA